MPSIEVGPLPNILEAEDIVAIERALQDADIDLSLDEDADSRLIDGNIEESFFEDLFDQLDANNLGCDIYVPNEFEDVVEAGDYRVGSAPALIMLLDDLRDEYFEDNDDDDEFGEFGEDEDEEFGHAGSNEAVGDLKGDYMRYLWKIMVEAARVSVEESTAMYLRR